MQVVRAVVNLEKLVRAGFTGAVSAGAPFAIDASMKAAIDRRLIVGPRLVPCSRDISTTGHAGDRSFPSHWEVGRPRGHPSQRRPRRVPPVGPPRDQGGRRDDQGLRHRRPRHGRTTRADRGDSGRTGRSHRGGPSRGAHGCAATSPTRRRCSWPSTSGSTSSTTATAWTPSASSGSSRPTPRWCRRCSSRPGSWHRWAGWSLGFTDDMRHDIEAMAAVLPEANRAGVRLVLGDDFGAINFPHGPYADELAYYVEEVGIPAARRVDLGHPQRCRGARPRGRARHGHGRQAGRPAGGGRRSRGRHQRAPRPGLPCSPSCWRPTRSATGSPTGRAPPPADGARTAGGRLPPHRRRAAPPRRRARRHFRRRLGVAVAVHRLDGPRGGRPPRTPRGRRRSRRSCSRWPGPAASTGGFDRVARRVADTARPGGVRGRTADHAGSRFTPPGSGPRRR